MRVSRMYIELTHYLAIAGHPDIIYACPGKNTGIYIIRQARARRKLAKNILALSSPSLRLRFSTP
jgi:hypothetical protein